MKPSIIPLHPAAFEKARELLLGNSRNVVIMAPRQSGKSQLAKTLKKMQDQQTKVARENEALHKTAAFLADEARRTERAMERGRHRR